MRAGRLGGLPPTLARAFDTNEYLNVLKRISRMLDERAKYAGMESETVTVRGVAVRLTNADLSEAHSIAAAMLHMSTQRREEFERNLLDAIPADQPAERLRVEALLAAARESLDDSKRQLDAEIARLQEQHGLDPTDPDTEIRARDNIY